MRSPSNLAVEGSTADTHSHCCGGVAEASEKQRRGVQSATATVSPRRMRFSAACQAEYKAWAKLSYDQQSLVRAFCACVGLRMQGRDPNVLLRFRDHSEGQVPGGAK